MNNTYRVQGLSIELKFVGEGKEYDLEYWTKLTGIKSMTRKEMSMIMDDIYDVIQKHYLRDRLDDIQETVETINNPPKQLNDESKPPLDDFLE